nr:aldolase [Pseudalkalibacillus sedimenti]
MLLGIYPTQKSYKSFGLQLTSCIYFPELEEVRLTTNADVSIEISDLTKLWQEEGNEGKFVVKQGRVLFKIEDTGIFCIEEGERVVVSPLGKENVDKMRLYILGSCMGAILLQRKILALHGSAIAIDGKAYAIVGDSGAGKSTLAASFIANGYKILSDDVIPVSLSNQFPIVIPSYPQQKLWSKSLEKFGIDKREFNPLFEREDKYAIPVNKHFYNDALPLGGIIELSKSECDQVELSTIRSLQAIHTLFNHTYRNFFVPRLGLMEWHFKITSQISGRVPCYRINRPTSQFTAGEIRDLILSTIKKGEKLHA